MKFTKLLDSFPTLPYGAKLPSIAGITPIALSERIKVESENYNNYEILFDPELGYYINIPEGETIDFIEIDGIRYSASLNPFPSANQFWVGNYTLPPQPQEKICTDNLP